MIGCAFLIGCSSGPIKPPENRNPPPLEALNNFSDYVVHPIELDPEYAARGANPRAIKKIQENLDLRLIPLAAEWKRTATTATVRTLDIQPRIKQLKFVSGSGRFWGSFVDQFTWSNEMTGDSVVVMTLELKERESGKLIATPEFYQHAKASAGRWTRGASDNMMLVRITSLAEEYLKNNYATAVGGPTGKPKE